MAEALTGRLPFIDALRGLAAVYIMLFHLIYLGNAPPPPGLGPLLFAGSSAVDIFFIVSAFSLCASSGDVDATASALCRFWIRRYWRIAPLFYLIVVLEILRLHRTPFEVSVYAIAANLSFAFGLMPSYREGIPMGGWTIGVEMLFYAVFPLLLARSRGPVGMALLCAGSAALAYCAGPVIAAFTSLGLTEMTGQQYFSDSLFIRLPLFMAGMACFRIYVARIDGRALPPVLGLAITLLACLLIGIWVDWEVLFIFMQNWSSHLADMATAAVTHQLAQCVIWSLLLIGLGIYPLALFVNPVTLFFGRISYSTYLLHTVIIVALRPAYGRIAAIGLTPGMTYLLDAVMTLGLVSPAAWLSFQIIEKPGMKAGKWLTARVPTPGLRAP